MRQGSLPRRSPDEVELLRRVRAGDRRAFDALFDVYYPRVHGFLARRLSDPAACRDATEAVLARWFDVMTGSSEPEEEPARSALALAQLELALRGAREPASPADLRRVPPTRRDRQRRG